MFNYIDMRMDDPIPQFSHVVKEIAKRHPALAYIHVVEPRVSGYMDREVQAGEVRTPLCDLRYVPANRRSLSVQ